MNDLWKARNNDIKEGLRWFLHDDKSDLNELIFKLELMSCDEKFIRNLKDNDLIHLKISVGEAVETLQENEEILADESKKIVLGALMLCQAILMSNERDSLKVACSTVLLKISDLVPNVIS